ncbi:AraC family transcriptional regulator ligand-binding domain-containing protein [Pseudomonas guguanensis]|uniref:AraC family transcriptional regulator n=1 Tax=Ectopseudomonas guguanensis TaxID=1198456 RepID=UPI0032665B33
MSRRLVSEMIQARALMGFAALVSSHGADPRALLSDVGIALDALENPDLPVPLDLLATLYHRAAQALDMADFGLRLSALQDSSIYGPLAEIALNSESVGDALQGLSRYFSYHTPGAEIETGPAADGRYIQVQYRLRLSNWVEPRQIIEQSYGMAAKLWRMIEPPGSEPIQILLRHQPAVDIRVYETFYGCPTVFEQAVDAVWLPVSAMAARIDHADSRLREASEQFISSVIRRFPLDLGKQVETLIIQQLPFGGASIERISAQLRMHKRTLQRRLAEQGILFGDLLDALREDQARQFLYDESVPLALVANLLGYNEQSSFIRACRRWFQATPLRLRQNLNPQSCTRPLNQRI